MTTTMKIRRNDEAITAIRARRAFTNARGSLSGRTVAITDGGVRCGELPSEDREDLLAHIDGFDWVYVIFSYGTPIAWVPFAEGTVPVMPRVRYSLTTTQHQHLVAQALNVEWRSWETEPRATGRGRSPYGSREGW